MKLKIVRIFAFLLICAAAVGVLWRQTHQSYQAVYEKPTESDSVTESEDEKLLEFPKRVEKEVSDGFSYNADIIIGKDFDINNFYHCTAIITKPDPQK